jgi:ABC-type branched-subunit amino acid transport system substrate-binding protein
MATKGMDFVAAVPTEVTDTDLSSQIATLKASGAEVVLLWTLPRQAAISLGASAASNFETQWIASFILADMPLMHDITKGLWEGVIFGVFGPNIYTMDNPRLQVYKDAIEKYQEGVRWGIFAYSGFAYAEPFVEGLKRAGKDLTREKLIEAMESIKDWTGTVNNITYGKDDHQALRSMFLAKCVGATEMDILTDYIEPQSDINAMVAKLHGE